MISDVSNAGHTSALGYPGSIGTLPQGQSQIPLEDLKPGLALVVDFAENMNQIIAINSQLLSLSLSPSSLRPELKPGIEDVNRGRFRCCRSTWGLV